VISGPRAKKRKKTEGGRGYTRGCSKKKGYQKNGWYAPRDNRGSVSTIQDVGRRMWRSVLRYWLREITPDFSEETEHHCDHNPSSIEKGNAQDRWGRDEH